MTGDRHSGVCSRSVKAGKGLTHAVSAVYFRGSAMATEADAFVKDYQGLVRSIAIKVRGQFDLTCDLDDLIAFGNQGLLQAKARFDPTRGVQMNTFAYYRIRGAVLDGVRRMAYLPRRIHHKVREAEAVDLVTEPIGEARAAAPEVRSDVGATAQALDDALSRVTASYLMSAVGQGPEDQPETPEEELVGAETRARVAKALEGLPEREQALVRGFYFDGRQFDEVASELGISKSWASRLHAKALDLLRDVLAEEG